MVDGWQDWGCGGGGRWIISRNDKTGSWVKQWVENWRGLTDACFEQIGARKKEKKRFGWRVLGMEGEYALFWTYEV